MIKPTVGRVVWYYGGKDFFKPPYQPLAAIVCFVETDDLLNLTVFGSKGECFPRERIRLVQDVEKAAATDNLPDSEFCTWMPFQKAQPAIAESVESRLKFLEDAVNGLSVASTKVPVAELDPVTGKPKLWVPAGNPGNPLPAEVPPGAGAPPSTPSTDAPSATPAVKQVTK